MRKHPGEGRWSAHFVCPLDRTASSRIYHSKRQFTRKDPGVGEVIHCYLKLRKDPISRQPTVEIALAAFDDIEPSNIVTYLCL